MLLMVFAFALSLSAQPGFRIEIQRGGVWDDLAFQSYVYGQWNGKVYFFGGRTDGLHRRQPWATFNRAGFNDEMVVFDLTSKASYRSGLDISSSRIRDQLSSTNMSFCQNDNLLYVAGGYGYSSSDDDYLSFPQLLIIDLACIESCEDTDKGMDICINIVEHDAFRVAGGRLAVMDSVFYLVGGHNFQGRYNPMGPDHGPGFIQVYTMEVRRFIVESNNGIPSVTFMEPWRDEIYLHKRDYNLIPQMFPGGKKGLTAFSGVFRHNADLPFYQSVSMDESGYWHDEGFLQYLNHYHSAALGIYSDRTSSMYNLFFGGIAQFYFKGDVLIQDDDVPFVNTIGMVSRDENGIMKEFRLKDPMPALLGAGSELILMPGLPRFSNGVLNYDELDESRVFLGYIVGGIRSDAPNVFWTSEGDMSDASSTLLEVYLVRENEEAPSLWEEVNKDYKLNVYANSENGVMYMDFRFRKKGAVTVRILDGDRKPLRIKQFNIETVGNFNHTEVFESLKPGDIYFIEIMQGNVAHTRQLIIR